VDDTYAINVAKSEYREGFNTGDAARVLSVFGPEFTDMSDGRPSRYRADAAVKLRAYLTDLFEAHEARLNVIIIDVTVLASTAYDYGWHELTLTPKNGGEPRYLRTRYMEVWSKQPNGEWRITKYIDNFDVADTID
jgi:ketosteroid isomerase-like protein